MFITKSDQEVEETIDTTTYSYLDRIAKSGNTELNLSNHGLKPRWGSVLSSFLSTDGRCITELNLSENCLGGDGVEVLCKYLKNDDKIVSLDLSSNNVDNIGIHALADLLDHNATLRHLSLANNHINDLECKALLHAIIENNMTLTGLNLRGNRLTEKSMDELASLLSTSKILKSLDISLNMFSEGSMVDLFSSLAKNTSIENLNLSSNNMADITLATAASINVPIPKLKVLNLSDNSLTNESLPNIIRLLDHYRTIESISIGSNSFTCEEIPQFLANISLIDASQKIRHVDLQNVFLTSDIRKEFNRLKMKNPGLLLTGLEGSTPVQGIDSMEFLHKYMQKNNLIDRYTKLAE